MNKGRLEAFSDGVIAIVITITVLLIQPPNGNDWNALKEIFPLISIYFVSFIMVGTYWVNHHHLLQITQQVNGKILWANLIYLFTISFFPVMTAWVGQSHFSKLPTIVYVITNLINVFAFIILEHTILKSHECEIIKNAAANSKKEFYTVLLILSALICAFFEPVKFMAYLLLLIMSSLWIIPDLRFKKVYHKINNKEE